MSDIRWCRCDHNGGFMFLQQRGPKGWEVVPVISWPSDQPIPQEVLEQRGLSEKARAKARSKAAKAKAARAKAKQGQTQPAKQESSAKQPEKKPSKQTKPMPSTVKAKKPAAKGLGHLVGKGAKS